MSVRRELKNWPLSTSSQTRTRGDRCSASCAALSAPSLLDAPLEGGCSLSETEFRRDGRHIRSAGDFPTEYGGLDLLVGKVGERLARSTAQELPARHRRLSESYYGRWPRESARATGIRSAPRRAPVASGRAWLGPNEEPSRLAPQDLPTCPKGAVRARYGETSRNCRATSAWIRPARDSVGAEPAFTRCGSINTRRRAYPQFSRPVGDICRRRVRIIFRWISGRSSQDPRPTTSISTAGCPRRAERLNRNPLVANAYGLMEVIPDTGRVVDALASASFNSMLTKPKRTSARHEVFSRTA